MTEHVIPSGHHHRSHASHTAPIVRLAGPEGMPTLKKMWEDCCKNGSKNGGKGACC